jgi:hypothetical protein
VHVPSGDRGVAAIRPVTKDANMLKGGIADKLGNNYEGLWTLLEALRVLRGQADEIRIDPFNVSQSSARRAVRPVYVVITRSGRHTWR